MLKETHKRHLLLIYKPNVLGVNAKRKNNVLYTHALILIHFLISSLCNKIEYVCK